MMAIDRDKSNMALVSLIMVIFAPLTSGEPMVIDPKTTGIAVLDSSIIMYV